MFCYSVKTLYTRRLAILWLVVFVLVSIVGVVHSTGMDMGGNGEMNGCIFMGEAAMCGMNAIEHISLWKNIFALIPQRVGAAAMLIAILTFAAFAVTGARNLLLTYLKKVFFQQKLYLSFSPLLAIFSPLRRAFAQGILHPRIYEPAIR